MGIEAWIIVGLALAAGVAIAVLGLRIGGLRTKARELEQEVHGAHAQASAFANQLKARARQLAALRVDIEELEDELAECSTRDGRRAILRRLLQKATDRLPDSADAELPRGSGRSAGAAMDNGPDPDWV